MCAINKITLVGCGTIGSALAYNLCLLSLDAGCCVSKIYLIDHDTLDEKNLPYLDLGENTNLLGVNKTDVLKHLLSKINPHIELISIPKRFEDMSYYKEKTFMVDCRDSINQDSIFDLKLNIDGHFGNINTNPQTNEEEGDSRYRFSNSKFCANVLATIVCRYIFDVDFRNKHSEGKSYAVNLMYSPEKLHEIEK